MVAQPIHLIAQRDLLVSSRVVFVELVDDLIALRTAGVDPKYIEEMRNVFSDLSLDDLVAMRIQGVSSKYVADLASAGCWYTSMTCSS